MSHESPEYTDEMAAGCELIWGKGFLSPGGSAEVELIVDRLDVREKKVLDIGCGLGGPSACLVSKLGAESVTGVDIETLNIERAKKYAAKAGLSNHLHYYAVDGGELPFANNTFDIVFSKDALTEAPNKADIMRESHRVLCNGGWIAMSDWFRSTEPLTEEMKRWIASMGVTLAMTTLNDTANLLTKVGFAEVSVVDRTAWYEDLSKQEAERMSDKERDRFEQVLGIDGTAEWIEIAKLQHTVVSQGQLRPGHLLARKP